MSRGKLLYLQDLQEVIFSRQNTEVILLYAQTFSQCNSLFIVHEFLIDT